MPIKISVNIKLLQSSGLYSMETTVRNPKELKYTFKFHKSHILITM